jgi:hypothetical protein
MSQPVLRLILDVLLTSVVALVLLGLWQLFLGTTPSDAPVEALRLLFLFMDVGLIVWVAVLVIGVVRGRRNGTGPGVALTLVWALVGTVVNAIVVTIVGFVQGGWAALLVLFAIEAGIATLLAAAIVVPIVHRVLVKPSGVTVPAA